MMLHVRRSGTTAGPELGLPPSPTLPSPALSGLARKGGGSAPLVSRARAPQVESACSTRPTGSTQPRWKARPSGLSPQSGSL
jgi:hypothetical protein